MSDEDKDLAKTAEEKFELLSGVLDVSDEEVDAIISAIDKFIGTTEWQIDPIWGMHGIEGVVRIIRGEKTYKLFLSSEDVEAAYREFLEEMQGSPGDLIAYVGEKALVRMWADGQTFSDWVDMALHDGSAYIIGSYDGTVIDLGCCVLLRRD